MVVCGPTATGKTSLAIRLAKKFNGWLISSDSKQVYKGMDIITGKDHPKKVKIELIDLVKPNRQFSVDQYYRLAWKAIRRAWKKKRLPVLVGGTGFYIKAVIDGVGTRGIPRNNEFRVKVKDWSKEKLFDYLARLDPEKAALLNWSDKNNPRRLVRAIEVALFKKDKPAWRAPKQPEIEPLIIGLKAPLEKLYQRIDERVLKRVKRGAEEEIKELLKKGYKWEKSALGQTLGYKEWQAYWEAEMTKEEVIKRWQFDEHGYARRQMTWFKKDQRVHWFDITAKRWQDKIEALVKSWYGQRDAKKG